jgi:hypothetical protein
MNTTGNGMRNYGIALAIVALTAFVLVGAMSSSASATTMNPNQFNQITITHTKVIVRSVTETQTTTTTQTTTSTITEVPNVQGSSFSQVSINLNHISNPINTVAACQTITGSLIYDTVGPIPPASLSYQLTQSIGNRVQPINIPLGGAYTDYNGSVTAANAQYNYTPFSINVCGLTYSGYGYSALPNVITLTASDPANTFEVAILVYVT